MASFTGEATVIKQSELVASSTAKHALGTIATTADGRKFRYVQAGSANVDVGLLVQSAPREANLVGLAVPTNTAAGNTSLTVTIGNTTVTTDQWTGGYAIISEGTGAGYKYRITSHPAASNNANLAITFGRDEALVVGANSSSTKVDIVPYPFKSVINAPVSGSKTGVLVGAAVTTIPNAQFGWVQTKGPAVLKVEGTPAIGSPVGLSANVAGAVSANTVNPSVGAMIETGVDAKYKLVFLNIE